MNTHKVRLTSLAHGGGCGCKLAPSVLQQLLADQPAAAPYRQLLVGTETADDAAVWQVDDNTCIIATTDFFMPMVDDPYDFGRIAATNAISDVYVMGGKPIMALAILGMPVDKIPVEMAREILKARRRGLRHGGHSVAGGHSIDCPEPVYGLAVIGICRPDQVRHVRARRRHADPDQAGRRRHLFGRDQEECAVAAGLRRDDRHHDDVEPHRRGPSHGQGVTPSPTSLGFERARTNALPGVARAPIAAFFAAPTACVSPGGRTRQARFRHRRLTSQLGELQP
jgi:hypothetical protein